MSISHVSDGSSRDWGRLQSRLLKGWDALPGRASDHDADLTRFMLIQRGALEKPHIEGRYPSPTFISCSVTGWGSSRKNVVSAQKLGWIRKGLELGAVSFTEGDLSRPLLWSPQTQLLTDTLREHILTSNMWKLHSFTFEFTFKSDQRQDDSLY